MPPHARIRLVGPLALALTLVGCPPGPVADAGAPAAGRTYRFRLGAAPEAEQVLRVVSADARVLRYEVRTRVAGHAVGPPLALEFSLHPRPILPPGEDVSLRVGGLTLPCRVSVPAAGRRVFTARAGGAVAFPGVVRVEDGEAVVVELVEIAEE